LLLHLLLDAQRALVAFSSPADGPADVDNVTYWRPFRPTNGDGGRAHAEYVTRAAAAYSSSQVLVEQWTETSTAAAWAGRREQVGIVSTQGHRLRWADLIDTLIVEATIHYLDLTLDLPAPPAPASALLHVRRGGTPGGAGLLSAQCRRTCARWFWPAGRVTPFEPRLVTGLLSLK
jgi:hypothetical protein